MTREEAIKYLIKPVATSTEIGEEKQKEFEAYDMAIEALQNEETFKTQLANCHKEILRLLDFNSILESQNETIKRQNDVIEIMFCKDCKWYKLTDHNETEVCTNKQWDISMAVYPIISANDYCSYGEKREDVMTLADMRGDNNE